MFEVHGNSVLYARLDLAQAPIRRVGIANQKTRFEQSKERIFHGLSLGCRGSALIVADQVDPVDLAALIGSRICHDLISPVGAISNGLELLRMSGAAGPELALIGESVDNANARIRFFRIAFGLASPDQMVGYPEITSILHDVYHSSRLKVRWDIADDCSRPDVRLAFLVIQCLETAMPYGGEIVVARKGDAWHATGSAEKMKVDEALWSGLENGALPKVAANCVHFALLPDGLARRGKSLTLALSDGRIEASF